MPIVSQDTMGFNGRAFRKVIKCSASGEFTIAFPEEINTAFHISKACGKSLKEANDVFNTYINRFNNARHEVKKVIVYGFQASCQYAGESGKDSDWVVHDSLSFCDGTGLGVAANVFEKHVYKHADGGEHVDYQQVESEIPSQMKISRRDVNISDKLKDHQEIDWTKDREAFFVKLHGAMILLVKQLAALHPAKAMETFIDSGRALEAPKEKKRGS